MIKFLAWLLLFCSSVASAAVNVNSTGQGTYNSGTATSHSWTHTPSGSPSNTLLLVWFVIDTQGTPNQVTGVTYNGVAMTELAVVGSGSTGNVAFLYGLVNPASGAQTVAVSFTSSTSFNGASILLADAEQTLTGIVGAEGSSGSGTTATTGSVTSALGDLVVGFVNYNNIVASELSSSSTTVLEDATASSGETLFGIASKSGIAGSTTMAWTSSTDTRWSSIAVSVGSDAGGGGSTAVPVFFHHYQQMSKP